MIIIPKNECSFNNWYQLFQKVSLNSVLIEIPHDVLHYLLEDGIVLPKEATFKTDLIDLVDTSSNEENIMWNSNVDDCEIEVPTFPEFSNKIKEIIEVLGGHAFIKVNWSAPSDATWITASKTLKCTNLEDIYLLLKSSNKITSNLLYLQSAKENNKPKAYLVLKEWIDIQSGTEFRCFVSNNNLIAITQRDSEFHSHMSSSKFDIINDIRNFFNNKLEGIFSLQNYVFDVVRSAQGITLLDIGEFCPKESKPYLFSWKELFRMEKRIDIEFRYIGESFGIQPNFECHGLPQDVKLLSNKYKGLSLMDIVQLEVKKQQEQDHNVQEK